MEDKQKCDYEDFNLQKHYDAIVTKLDEIKNYEIWKDRNAKLSGEFLDLENKKTQLMDLAKFKE